MLSLYIITFAFAEKEGKVLFLAGRKKGNGMEYIKRNRIRKTEIGGREMNNKAMYNLSYGLFVLSAQQDGKDNGCIINTAGQVTTEPNQITIAVNKLNLTHDMVAATKKFTVSILSEQADFSLFQRFGFQQWFLVSAYPDIFGPEPVLDALNFVLGCHPGSNTASFASGVGAVSTTTAYGTTRADWSYIPGGVVSGTAIIRPDFPELLEFPYLWQQTEYVLGGGSSHYMFLVLAAQAMLQ